MSRAEIEIGAIAMFTVAYPGSNWYSVGYAVRHSWRVKFSEMVRESYA